MLTFQSIIRGGSKQHLQGPCLDSWLVTRHYLARRCRGNSRSRTGAKDAFCVDRRGKNIAGNSKHAVGDDSCSQGGTLANYLLRLYVTGTSPRAEVAIANLRRICEQELRGRYELEIIDVLEQPQLAEDEKVLATPTLIKQLPPPLRRVIGDLSDKDKVLLGLEVRPAATDPNPDGQ